MDGFFSDPTVWTGWAFAILLGAFVVFLVLTDRLVSRGRLNDEQKQTALWKSVAMEALSQNGTLVDSQTTAKTFYAELLDKSAGPRKVGAEET